MNEFLALLTFLGIFVTASCSILEKYTRKSGDVYHGRYTRDVPEPDFLVPRRVFEDGSFHTYSLPNFYDRQEMNERKKRSLAGSAVLDTDKLHLVLPFNGIDHHVELSPYHEFISPEMVIETRGAGVGRNLNEGLKFKRAPDEQCHYRGVIRGHDNSRAALSLCDGVVGYVQTNHGRYFIEPVSAAEPEPDGQHVHIAYKRDSLHGNLLDSSGISKRFCGTSDNWETAWAEQLAKRQKRIMENNSPATKRSLSGTHSIHRYIEIGLVADRRFLDYHNNTNYEQYLLTIMNMVSDYYHDSSSGNQIDVVVVRVIYLEKEKEEIDLLISPAAEDTLASFAKWANKINPADHKHPNHFDIAVLVTRYDICSEGTNCDLMGLAYVGAACDSAKAACINEENGLLLGIVIAHEVGHVMGCSHDEPETSGCPSQDKDESYFIMSPIVFIFTVRWSSCSRKFITAFLESGLGECLNDNPRSPSDKFKYPNMLPGAMYGADFQCSMEFSGGTMCPQKGNDCNNLWCHANNTCYCRGTPMADGTKCGEKKWCVHKKCVDMGTRPAAVNGGWGPWGPMSSCTRTCGGGVKYSERECDKPVPANGGRYCMGERKKISLCNTTPCDSSQPPYRALQCAEHNSEKVLTDDKLHQWTPYSSSVSMGDPCVLYCINEEKTFIKMAPTVNDSTPCKPGTNYMCIAGTCRKVGCDWVLDSDIIEDKCGICRGDGTKCKAIEGLYNNTFTAQGYQKVVAIPKGARSIRAAEKGVNQNMLAVVLEKNNTYCLNGNYRERRSGDYDCAGALIIYTHPEPDKEEIEIKGPITEDIRIEYMFYHPKENPGIQYAYYVMTSNTSYSPKYIWDFIEWSECDAKCGGGTMISDASCIEEHGGKVSLDFCNAVTRPEPKSRICNQNPCAAKWRVSQWSKCSACDGKKGTKHRKVQCVRAAARAGEDDVQANLDACKGRVPKQTDECIGQRPCRKMCPKKTRSLHESSKLDEPSKELSIEDQRKMIDKFVDFGLARYVEKARRVSREDDHLESIDNDDNFRRLLRDWPIIGKDKKKSATWQFEKNITTPKPGSIVKDTVPISNVILMQAPYMEENLQSNLSDKAFQESGDLVGGGIDTSREKIYKGQKAVQMIEQLNHRNTTIKKRSVENEEAYDGLAAIVDAGD